MDRRPRRDERAAFFVDLGVLIVAKTESVPDPDGLSPKQRRFVDEYAISLNATRAAIAAGYSERSAQVQSSRLLSNAMVSTALQKLLDKRAAKVGITQEMVLAELAKIGFADIRKAVTWGTTEMRVVDDGDDESEPKTAPYHGLALKGADEIDDDTAAAISEVSEGRDGLKVKFHDKQAALVNIGRHLGMFKDKTELSGPGGGPIEFTTITRRIIKPK